MYLNFNIKIYVPRLIERIAVAIALWYRLKRYGFTYRRIKLTRDKYTIVDAEDFAELNKFKWHTETGGRTPYASRVIRIHGRAKKIAMHRAVMKYDGPLFIDHKNRNGLDNRKANLRLATYSQNSCNRPKNESKLKGVVRKPNNKFEACIKHKGKRIYLGFFDNKIDAAKAYDEAAKKYYGEFAVLNFEDGQPRGFKDTKLI